MKQANDRVHRHQQFRRPQRPPAPQHQVINILKTQPRNLAEDIHLVQQFLEIHHPHVPRPLLAANHFAQRIGRAAMSSARIEEHEFDGLHSSRF